MADHMRTELVTAALDMAIAARGGHAAGVIAHADRGSGFDTLIWPRFGWL
jgi:transposase InsO family protein